VTHSNAKAAKHFCANNAADLSKQEIHLLQVMVLNVEIAIKISDDLNNL
jgi:hypothetical protein